MRILRTPLFDADLKRIWGASLRDKIAHFWRKGWNEIPEIMFTTPIALASIVAVLYLRFTTTVYDRPPKFYRKITIYRPDDPRVANIRKDNGYSIEPYAGVR
ncbi:uncharacterized protein LOC116430461 [Nomia melanderi]|uniref:uncharacterized protein LOC116430461 n=1 Tax=Nomia melanderi TaxID=2448451 RepID=UPI0013042988|nr:uncharacterized protein LOC116430461 [Nomia melanderi]